MFLCCLFGCKSGFRLDQFDSHYCLFRGIVDALQLQGHFAKCPLQLDQLYSHHCTAPYSMITLWLQGQFAKPHLQLDQLNSHCSVFQAYNDWQDNPVLTTVQTTGMPISKIDFPAITICSQGTINEVRFQPFNEGYHSTYFVPLFHTGPRQCDAGPVQ